MIIYVDIHSGAAYTSLRSTVRLAQIPAKLGYDLTLDVVFTDGGEAVELGEGAEGIFAVKDKAGYDSPALFALTDWTKAQSASGGYRFVGRVAGEALKTLLDSKASITLICDVSWVDGETRMATQEISFTLANQIWRDDEPVLPDPDPPYPHPSDVVTHDDLDGALEGLQPLHANLTGISEVTGFAPDGRAYLTRNNMTGVWTPQALTTYSITLLGQGTAEGWRSALELGDSATHNVGEANGVAGLAGNGRLPASQLTLPAVGTISGTEIPLSGGGVYQYVATDDVTFTLPSSPVPGSVTMIAIDNSGGYEITWPGSITWQDTIGPDLVIPDGRLVELVVVDTGDIRGCWL